jgi:hypothetical protein
MNIGEKIFARRPTESEQAYQERVKETKQVFTNALNCDEGRQLLELLCFHSPPFAPRFTSGADPHQAAFLDGEKHLLGLLVIHGGYKA